MRTMINATLAFGAIFVPVGVAKASGREEIKFRTLHVDCGQPIKKMDRCPVCDVTIETTDDLVKGWEFAKNTFLTVDEEDMAAITMERSKMIELTKFVPRSEIDPNMIERSYFLTPNEVLVQPYELIAAALMGKGVCGIGRATLWGKEFPIMVEAGNGGILMLRYLFCTDELRSGAEAVASLTGDINVTHLAMAEKFIDLQAGALEADDLAPNARLKTMAYLEAKVKGVTITQPDPHPDPEPTIDLTARLKEMVS